MGLLSFSPEKRFVKQLQPTATYTPTYFSPNYGVGLSLAIGKKVEFGAELIRVRRQYRYADSLNFNVLGVDRIHSLTYTEGQTWWDVPVWFSYTLRLPYRSTRPQVVYPYINGGVTFSFLGNAEFEVIRRVSRTPNESPDFIAEDREFSLLQPELRSRFGMAVSAGGGLKFKLKTDYLALDFRYNLAFLNMVNTQNRYANQDLIFKYGHVDNDKRMNQYALSLMYVRPIFCYKKRRDYKVPDLENLPQLTNQGKQDDNEVIFVKAEDKDEEEGYYEVVWESENKVLAYSEGKYSHPDFAKNEFPYYASFDWSEIKNYRIETEKGRYFVLLLGKNSKPIARSERSFGNLRYAVQERDSMMRISDAMPKSFSLVQEPDSFTIILKDQQGNRIGESYRKFADLSQAQRAIEFLPNLRPINFDIRREVNSYQLMLLIPQKVSVTGTTNTSENTESTRKLDSLIFLKRFATERNAKDYLADQRAALNLPTDSFSISRINKPYEILIRDGDGEVLFTLNDRYRLETEARFIVNGLEKTKKWKIDQKLLQIEAEDSVYKIYLEDMVGDSIAMINRSFASNDKALNFMRSLTNYRLKVRPVDLKKPFRNPTEEELELRARQWVLDQYQAFRRGGDQIGSEELDQDVAALLAVIEQEINRLRDERKLLGESLRKGALDDIEKDLKLLKEWREELKQDEKDARNRP